MPRISIIMGVYNCKNKELLKESIYSIINQTFTDWELLICDDGSTDNTLEYLKKFSLCDKRIKIFSYKKNRGLSYALNILINKATGEYIARQDDDDISYSDRLQKQIQFMDQNKKYDIVGTLADIYNSKGIWGKYKVIEEPTKSSFLWNSPFIHPTVMMRKEILIKSGCYRVSKETRRCEDYDLFMRMYSLGYRGYNIQQRLYKYYLENNPKNKYRPMKYRIDEAIIRYQGYKKMKILLPKGMVYVIKPLIIGLIPQKILYRIKKEQY